MNQDREFVEQDLVEAQLSQQANADSQPQTLSLSKKLKLAAKGSTSTTSGCIYSCCRLRNRRSRRESSGGGTSASPSAAGPTATGEAKEAAAEWELNDMEAGASSSRLAQQQVQQRTPSARGEAGPTTSRAHQQLAAAESGASTSKLGAQRAAAHR